MEDTIRRTAARRNTISQRRRSRPVYNFRILRKILVQLIASGLILICVLGVKNLNAPLTGQMNIGISNLLHTSLDFKSMYKGISDFTANSYSKGKEFFKKQLMPQPEPQPINPSNNTQESSPNQGDIKNPPASVPDGPAASEKTGHTPTNGTSISAAQTSNTPANSTKKVVPVLSSINSADIDVKSIRSQYVFVQPVKGGISSDYGLRIHPITKLDEFHPGLDIKANTGTPILASLGGTVIEARRGQTFGNFIKILSGKDITSVYAHCSKLLVKKGQKIQRGQRIGEVGATGLASGPHLHFEIWKGDRPVDPASIINSYGK